MINPLSSLKVSIICAGRHDLSCHFNLWAWQQYDLPAEAIKDYEIAAKITVVIGNRRCAGISLAQNCGLATKVIERKDFNTHGRSMRLP